MMNKLLLISILLNILLISILCAENVKDLNSLAALLDNNIKILTDILKTSKEKENPELWRQLGIAYQNKDAHFHTDGGALRDEALKAFNNALKYSNNDDSITIQVNHYLGMLYKMMSQGENAIIAHNNALKVSKNPWDRSAALVERASALNMLGRVEAAIQDYRSAIQLTPLKRSAYLPLAMCYKELNFLSKSEWYELMKEIEESINQLMDDASKRLKESAILVDSHNLDAESSSVYWALYLSAEKAGLIDKAWHYLEKAHDIDKTKKIVKFDEIEASAQRDNIISVFNSGFWPQNIGYNDATPVFIVGMMRSGSTLLETMLDAHEGIIGLGEDSIFNSNLPQFRDQLVATIAKQEFLLVRDLVNNFGLKIINRMKSAAQTFINTTEHNNIKRIIDKMLFNYRNIGFIHLVYPNAVILHTIRDPMDTILSCYTHKFDDIGLSWSLNIEHMTQTYAIYVEIMHHFHSILPNRVIDVVYEDLVHNPENVMRKVLKELGQQWDPKILDFHKRRRSVQTHSSAQVRKNIYKSSIGGWRKYLHNLIPAINSLQNYLKVLKERNALPHANLINWDLDPFYDYKDDFKFNISKAEYLKLLEEDNLKRNKIKGVSSVYDDDESDEEEFQPRLKRRRSKKNQQKKKKSKIDVIVDDDGDTRIEYDEDYQTKLLEEIHDIYSATINKLGALKNFIKNLKYKNDNVQINELIALGNYFLKENRNNEAIDLFKKLAVALKGGDLGTRILIYKGLGTAYALTDKFNEAISAFSKLLELDPSNIEELTKRSQLLRASGTLEAAIADVNKLIDLGEDNVELRLSRGLSLLESGYFKRASEDFYKGLDYSIKNNASKELKARLYHLLGQCEKEFGETLKSLTFHNKSLELMPNLQEYYFAYATTAVMGGLWEEALVYIDKTLGINDGLKNAYGYRGLLYQNLGMAKEAITDLKKTLSFDPNDINPLLLLGVSYQGLGKYDEAFKVFDTIINIDRNNPVWFRKEFISYFVGKLDTEFKNFNVDNEFDPIIKDGIIELQTTASIPKSYVPYGSITSMTYMRRQSIRNDSLLSSDVLTLLNDTKNMTIWIQIDSPGFLPHKRHHMMFRFCVLEIAETLKNHINLLSEGKEGLVIPDRMSSKKDYYGVRTVKGGHVLGWRDLYDIAVRWRQLSEPKDAVWWIDRLPQKRKSRIGLNTYVTKGSHKVIRYGEYHEYAFNITRQYLATFGYYNHMDKFITLSEDMKDEVLAASTVDELYNIIDQPFYVNIRCESSLYPGLFLNGTRIVINKGEKEGYDLSIVSVSTQERFLQYEEELHMAYRRLVSSLLARKREENTLNNAVSNDEIAIQNIAPALEMFYYWINLSPISRSSAVTGYMVLFASILAQDEELLKKIPKNKQLDWEAFFSESPNNFIKLVGPWFLERRATNVFDSKISVSSLFTTPRDILNLISKA